jgi:protein-S-isoprenylcysteine O-methyltransferase Ste14
MSQPSPDLETKSAGVVVPPPLIYAGTLAASLLLDLWIGGSATGLGSTFRAVIGIALIVIGLAIPIVAAAQFRKADTEVRPWKPSTALVTTGIYRFTRNPMYLGMTLIYAGLALLADSALALLVLLLLLAIIQYGVIKREEHYLEITFGEAYRDYRSRVRRWF